MPYAVNLGNVLYQLLLMARKSIGCAGIPGRHGLFDLSYHNIFGTSRIKLWVFTQGSLGSDIIQHHGRIGTKVSCTRDLVWKLGSLTVLLINSILKHELFNEGIF